MTSNALVTTQPTTARTAEVQRNTAETRVHVRVNLDGTGQARWCRVSRSDGLERATEGDGPAPDERTTQPPRSG